MSSRRVGLCLALAISCSHIEHSVDPIRRTHYASGQLWSEGRMEQGLRVGTWTTWYPDGTKKSIETFEAGRLEGEAAAFWPGGQVRFEGSYKLGRPDGLWERFYKDGTPLSSGHFELGRKVGHWSNWYPHGELQIEADYDPEGAPGDGLIKRSREDGTPLSEGRLKGGLRSGPWRQWRPDGQLDTQHSGVFEEGRRVGPLEG